MITQKQIDETVSWDGLRDFGRFVLSYCKDGGLPDYEEMNLMDVPKLVPYIWVNDLRSEDKVKDLMMGFAGEKHTELHGKNVSGTSDVEIFEGYDTTEDIVEHYQKSIREKCPAYNKRDTKLTINNDVMYRNIETLFFPCSSNGKAVDWGIGCLTWETTIQKQEKIFLYF